jgi:catecholate siderophore receptor
MQSGNHSRKHKHSSKWAPSWFAAGAVGLTVCGAAGGAFTRPAYAGPHARNWSIHLLTQSAASYHFEIEPGMLTDILGTFEKTTGLKVALSREGIGMLASPGIKGDYTADRALQLLLAGTGVVSRYTASQAVTLELQTLSSVVSVSADAGEPNPSSPKYTEPLREIPQTIEVIPRAVMEAQGAVTLSDALRNVPGITIQAGEGGGASNTTGDMFNMRGFNASNSLFVDGVRDDGLISRNVYNVEQVEVFLGPTGSDVGRGTASGYVNMATKTPTVRSFYNGSLSYDSADQTRSTIDMNIPLPLGSSGSWWSRAAARINGLWQQGGVPGRDAVRLKNRSIAPSVGIGLGSPTRLTVSSEFTRQNNIPDYGIPGAAWADEPLSPTTIRATNPVAQTNFYGSTDFDYDEVSQSNVTARVEHDVNDHLSLRYQARYNTTHRDAVVSALGAFAPATETVAILRQGNDRLNRIISNQANMTGRFSTSRFIHAISGGLEYTYEDQFTPTIGGTGTRGPVDIYRPDPGEAVTGYAPFETGALSKGWTNTVSLYAFDTVDIGRWQLSGGLRWEHYRTNFRTLATTGLLTVDEQAKDGLVSGKAGILYKLTSNGNAYFSYGSTATPPGTANFTLSSQVNNQNNPNVDPQKSRNIEIGSKWDFFSSRLSVTGAAFHTINEDVIFTVDATAVPPIFNQDDKQRVQGISLGIVGRLTQRLQLLANFGVLDSELQSQNSVNNGKHLTLTPPFSGSLWATYVLPFKLSVGGGLQYMDKVWVNAANTIKVPSYMLADAVVEYPVTPRFAVRLNISNLTDNEYVRTVNNNANRYNPGRPRSVMLTTNFSF